MWMTQAAIGLLVLGLAIVTERRHRRLRRRYKRLEAGQEQLLDMIRALYTERVRRDLDHMNRTPRTPIASHSEHGEDIFLYELFADQATGFYIEAGAFDGVEGANTLLLDAIGWDGLLVEPVPELYRRAIANRPNTRVVNAALGPDGASGTVRFRHVTGRNGAYASSSRIEDAHAGSAKFPPATDHEIIDVPYTSLNAILENHNDPIDLAVIDVEGHEPQVLRGFDLNRWRPRVLMVEDQSYRKDSVLHTLLDRAGYRHVHWIAWNRLFIHQSELELLNRASALAPNAELRASAR